MASGFESNPFAGVESSSLSESESESRSAVLLLHPSSTTMTIDFQGKTEAKKIAQKSLPEQRLTNTETKDEKRFVDFVIFFVFVIFVMLVTLVRNCLKMSLKMQ